MEIKAVKFRKGGFYSQPFVFGGEEGTDKFDKNVRYRGSLQNYLIDTGDEVILVDTGLPAGTPEEVPTPDSMVYTGKDISSYMDAFKALGYKPEQVTKILLTHKHGDHSGEISSFPNAKVYVNEEELSAAELQGKDNLVSVKFTDGAYYNFPESQKISEGIYFIKAKGHTNGNSLVVVENEGLFYSNPCVLQINNDKYDLLKLMIHMIQSYCTKYIIPKRFFVMDIAVRYCSKTKSGNTRRIAEAIGDGILQ